MIWLCLKVGCTTDTWQITMGNTADLKQQIFGEGNFGQLPTTHRNGTTSLQQCQSVHRQVFAEKTIGVQPPA